ncbi:MAG: Maf family nucleotide pyrophosphatase [Microscillaceae bacterium]|nr:Maf family nucleotide pyrophosphatase [Microscillaceae bacterium]
MRLILASKSPRRQQLLESAGFSFEIRTKDIFEEYPPHIPLTEVPLYLARLKAEAFVQELLEGDLLITSDTVVIQNQEIIGKPLHLNDAKKILNNLSGQMHEVWSGVCLRTVDKEVGFSEQTFVYFQELSEAEIDHYLYTNPPLDKAGAYGIQDWIGLIGVRKIEGCFYNVMGLPVSRLYQEIRLHFPDALT